MNSLLKSLPLFGLALVLALPTPAHARFGKSGSGGGGHPGGGHPSGPRGSPGGGRGGGGPSGGYHTAGPAGPRYSPYSGGGYRRYGGYSGYGYGPGYRYGSGYGDGFNGYGYGYGYGGPSYGWGYGYEPLLGGPVTYIGIDGTQLEGSAGPPPQVVVTAGADAQVLRQNGGALGVRLGIEGHRWGFSSDLHSVVVGTNDGTRGTDAIHLLNAHVTYALLSGPHGRLRLEAGADSAFAPDATFLGPGFAVSTVVGLMGPVSFEGRMGLTPFPFTQVDWNAGLVVGLGPVGIRGGWRSTYLNDQGRVDGTIHEDLFDGPYVGLSLAL